MGVISEFKLSQTFDDILGAVEEIVDGFCVCVCVCHTNQAKIGNVIEHEHVLLSKLIH